MDLEDATLFEKLVAQFSRFKLVEMADQGPQGPPDHRNSSTDEEDDNDNDESDSSEGSYSSESSDSDDGIDENEQLNGDVQLGYLRVHDAVLHPNSFHCPPFPNMDALPLDAHANYDVSPCDCLEFGIADCFRDSLCVLF